MSLWKTMSMIGQATEKAHMLFSMKYLRFPEHLSITHKLNFTDQQVWRKGKGSVIKN